MLICLAFLKALELFSPSTFSLTLSHSFSWLVYTYTHTHTHTHTHTYHKTSKVTVVCVTKSYPQCYHYSNMANRIKILLKRPNTQKTNSTPVQLAKTHSTQVHTLSRSGNCVPLNHASQVDRLVKALCVCVENQHVVYIIPNRYSKRYDRQWLVKRVILDYRAHVCVFQCRKLFSSHVQYVSEKYV